MESPLKKPVFASEANKENYERDEIAIPIKGITLPDELPEEEDANNDNEIEPLLRENPNRFVMFPIKYHEVRRVLSNIRV